MMQGYVSLDIKRVFQKLSEWGFRHDILNFLEACLGSSLSERLGECIGDKESLFALWLRLGLMYLVVEFYKRIDEGEVRVEDVMLYLMVRGLNVSSKSELVELFENELRRLVEENMLDDFYEVIDVVVGELGEALLSKIGNLKEEVILQ